MTAGIFYQEPLTFIPANTSGDRSNIRQRLRRSRSESIIRKNEHFREEAIIRRPGISIVMTEKLWSHVSRPADESLSSSSEDDCDCRNSNPSLATVVARVPTVPILRSSSCGAIRYHGGSSCSSTASNSSNGSSSQGSSGCVRFSASPVSSVRERPLTDPQEKEALFYSKKDFQRFRSEYKIVLKAIASHQLTKTREIEAEVSQDDSLSSDGDIKTMSMFIPPPLRGLFRAVSESINRIRLTNVSIENDPIKKNLLVDTMYLF